MIRCISAALILWDRFCIRNTQHHSNQYIYIILPASVAKACNLDPKTTYRVKKYIYGLPDAGRAYYIEYRDHLIASGYTMTASDPCLFGRLVPEQGIRTYAWIHVEDTIVASTHEAELD